MCKRENQTVEEVNSQIMYEKNHKFWGKKFTMVMICCTSYTKLILVNFPVYFGYLFTNNDKVVLLHFLSCPVPVVNDSMHL